jgi:hypothetical protein
MLKLAIPDARIKSSERPEVRLLIELCMMCVEVRNDIVIRCFHVGQHVLFTRTYNCTNSIASVYTHFSINANCHTRDATTQGVLRTHNRSKHTRVQLHNFNRLLKWTNAVGLDPRLYTLGV